ncbi:MAG: Spo0B domain-containing protein [Deltaproteobacteria bacterium]|nr:Spo0B domain-containing protein [Deltaproteobacteria bacterium]
MRRYISLQTRIFTLVIVTIIVSIIFETMCVEKYLENFIIKNEGKRILSIAEITAKDPRIIDAFNLPDPSLAVQPIAEEMRRITNTSFVVIFNMDTIRYSHPKPDRLGKHFVGGDEKDSLKGKQYISQAKGTLGISQRAFVPIFGPDNRQLGVVSVGLLMTELKDQKERISFILYFVALISVLVGFSGAAFLASNIKKTILGLEPHEIAALLEQRSVIISSIKEGVVAIDADKRVILLNETAKKLLSIGDLSPGTLITDVVPASKLPLVVETGEPIIDEEQRINSNVILTNRIPLRSRGKIIGAVATFRDMSEIRNLAEELTEVKSYINALRAQHHEYLNKLHVISGLLQLRKYKQAVEFIVRTVSKTQEIADFLRRNIKSPAVSGLLLAKLNEALEYDIDLVILPESYFPVIRESCVGTVTSIIGNILQNSIESLRDSSQEKKKIVVFLREYGNYLEIVIKDNGKGFSKDLCEKVFERGYTTKKSSKNKGIGLSLVKEYIEHFGGTIEVRVDGGVEFRVTVPKSNIT